MISPSNSDRPEAAAGADAPPGGSIVATWLRRGIGPRLLALIVLFSSAVTLTSTLVQLYLDYRQDVSAIENRMNEIERGYLGSVAASLWHVDATQIRLQLEGILRLPDMQSLEVRESAEVERPLTVRVGEASADATISRDFPLVYLEHGVPRRIGMLHVEASLADIYRRLAQKAVVILISQGLKTFLVSLFILYVFHRLVTRHLVDIARAVGSYDFDHPAPLLALAREAPATPDELDRMVTAFNAIRGNLQRAFDDLREANEALEQDIIARRRAEEEVTRLNAVLEQRVRQRTAELEAANKELGAFTYSVSHDLRAPLRRIEGFGRILIEEHAGRLDERGLRYLDRIRVGAREMADMIDSFLRLSRATQGELMVENADLSRIATGIVARLAEKEPDRAVAVDIAPGLKIEGDRRLLSVALENLLENAWKYTRKAEHATIAFAAGTGKNGQTVYFVRDNGAGFDIAFADRLFVPFSRLHRGDEFEGTGIGLATVQRIVARHGGRVWAEGEIDQGATIYFTFWESESGR